MNVLIYPGRGGLFVVYRARGHEWRYLTSADDCGLQSVLAAIGRDAASGETDLSYLEAARLTRDIRRAWPIGVLMFSAA